MCPTYEVSKLDLKQETEARLVRGYSIIAKGVNPKALGSETWLMPSQTTNEKYLVRDNGDGFECECPDFIYRHNDCKHIHAVRFWLKMKEKVRQQDNFEIQQELSDRCIYCYSDNIIKKDKRQTQAGLKQRYLCKNCNRKFVADPIKRIKGNGKIVSLVLDLYFKGISLRKIQNHLQQFYNLDIDHSTIYRWIEKFVGIMNRYLEQAHPQTSETWHADEQMVKVNGKWMWNYNLLDADTRFLLANQITKDRSIRETRMVFRNAKKVTQDIPEKIITDGLWSYERAIKKEFNPRRSGLKHIRLSSIRAKVQNNKIERFHNTFRERDKTMRGFKKENTPIVSGFNNYYNYIRPHQSLNGMTPSEVAGINLNITENNRWLGLLRHSINGVPINNPKPKERKKYVKYRSPFIFRLKVFDKDRNELNPKQLGLKDKFINSDIANRSVEFYKTLHPEYEFKLENSTGKNHSNQA